MSIAEIRNELSQASSDESDAAETLTGASNDTESAIRSTHLAQEMLREAFYHEVEAAALAVVNPISSGNHLKKAQAAYRRADSAEASAYASSNSILQRWLGGQALSEKAQNHALAVGLNASNDFDGQSILPAIAKQFMDLETAKDDAAGASEILSRRPKNPDALDPVLGMLKNCLELADEASGYAGIIARMIDDYISRL